MKCRFILVLLALLALILSTATLLYSDGEPAGDIDNSGVLVPMDEDHAHVLDQHVDITLPRPSRQEYLADVHVQYVLSSDQKKPLDINVAWPTGGAPYNPKTGVGERIYIKMDNRPVAYNVLSITDLEEPYIRAWLTRIDKLLAKMPQLKQRVLQIRKEHPVKSWTGLDEYGDYRLQKPSEELGRWMITQGLLTKGHYYHYPGELAAGLLGFPAEFGRRDITVQSALLWLEPGHKMVDLQKVLGERWGYGSVLLDPGKRRLVYVDSTLGPPPSFVVIRFPIRLMPGKKHHLIVGYKQQIGGERSEDWRGLAYLMEPARRWGRWDKTTITVKVPSQWRSTAIRPHMRLIRKKAGYTTYRTSIDDRPYENLYISVVAPRSVRER